jgi:hypothetical protein
MMAPNGISEKLKLSDSGLMSHVMAEDFLQKNNVSIDRSYGFFDLL